MRDKQHEVMGGGLRGLPSGPVENKNFAPLFPKVDDEEKEELNENYEQLLLMLYWDS